MEVVTPYSPHEAQRLADALGERGRFIAGGTALQQAWDETRLAPAGICFIDVQRWPETQQIGLSSETLRIGAGACLESVRRDPLALAHAPLLVEALCQLGAPGVRRLGTLGGNIGWGMGDTAPVLLALEALLELADGTLEPMARTLDRAVRPLIVALHVPRADRHVPVHAAFEKIGYRAAFSPARLRMALRWHDARRGCRVSHVAVAAPDLTVRRLRAVEALVADPAQPPGLDALRSACLADLPAPLAAMASRLVAGHCGLL